MSVKRIRSPEEMKRISDVMNDHVKGERVVAHSVPTRAIRVVVLKGDLIFRVQQLNPNSWKWTTLSTHQGDDPWESYGPALADAAQKQEELRAKLLRMKVDANQAERMHNATRSVARGQPLPTNRELIFDD